MHKNATIIVLNFKADFKSNQVAVRKIQNGLKIKENERERERERKRKRAI
jgi:hypothetical protein